MATKTKKADFENDHLLYEKALKSATYKKLINKIKKHKKFFLIGNGGLMDVSSHGSADLSRLIPNKSFRSFNDAGFMSSNANDYGFENCFTIWLQNVVLNIEDPKETMIIGLSCSGNSKNVIDALKWAKENGYGTFLIDGVKSKTLPKGIDELTFGCSYFHTNEVLTMKLFYDIVYKTGNHCPSIEKEIKRKEACSLITKLVKESINGKYYKKDRSGKRTLD